MTTKPEPEELSYERAVDLFDAQLRVLEEGDLTLDEAIRAVDEAGRLLRTAERKLEEAKKRIEVRPAADPESPPGADPTPAPRQTGPAAGTADEPPPPDDVDAPYPEELPF